MELSELTQSQSYEADALAFGLLACLIVGICIVFGYAFHRLLERSPYDETSGKPHPADDVYNADVWGLVEQYKRDNPERAYFPREGNDGR